MSRARSGVVSKRRHKKILKLSKGYRGRSKNCFRIAIQKVEKALQYAYRDRRAKKSQFRSLWIQRINAEVRKHGLIYSVFMKKIKDAGINLDRKSISELFIKSPQYFDNIIHSV
ncbi:MAG: 50S ribosomal protein L20 [Rickettsia sp.]|nr:50S ribosomal protein L20 [Rickettsia sp.]